MNPMELGRIGVLAGGPSNEREISLESGKAVFNALKDAGADAVFLDIKKADGIKKKIQNAGIDIAFIALHGRFGEDGTIQAILEDMNMPYTGSGPLASRLALDKIASKEIFVRNGIAVPEYEILDKRSFAGADLKAIASKLGSPLVIKPQFEGSSIGVSIVMGSKAMKKAIDAAFKYGEKIIIEKCIKGRELTVGILKDEPLPVIEIVVQEKFYNFKAKYKSGETQYLVPAKINGQSYKAAQAAGRMAHKLLGCKFFSRVDMMLDEATGKIFVLEVNSIPGFTSHSLLPKAAAYAGITFSQLCLEIAQLALEREMEVNRVG